MELRLAPTFILVALFATPGFVADARDDAALDATKRAACRPMSPAEAARDPDCVRLATMGQAPGI